MTSPIRPAEDRELRKLLARWGGRTEAPLSLALLVGMLLYGTPVLGYLLMGQLPIVAFSFPRRWGGTFPMELPLSFPATGFVAGLAASLLCAVFSRVRPGANAFGAFDRAYRPCGYVIGIAAAVALGYIVVALALGHSVIGLVPSEGPRSLAQVLFDCVAGLVLGASFTTVLGFALLLTYWLPFIGGTLAIAVITRDLDKLR